MSLVIASEPTSLVAVDDQCSAVEAWAERCDSIPELRDATNRLAAIDEYLTRTSTEGRGRVAAAMRRLEVRIGKLLGPATPNGGNDRNGSVATDPFEDGLTRHQRTDFRQMAENEDEVEKAISESTDEVPASRRSITARIRAARDANPIIGEGSGKTRAEVAAKVEKAKQMAASGSTSRQIATAIGITFESMSDFRKRHGVEVPADAVVGRQRRIDPNRVVSTIALDASHIAAGMDVLDLAYDELDRDRIPEWVSSLSEAIRSLTTLKRNLEKELTQ